MAETRAATLADIPILVELWYERALLQQLQLAPDARDRWAAAASTWLGEKDTAIFVAENDDQLLGYVVGRVQPASPGLIPEWQGVITEIAIDVHHYHGGVGRLLVNAIQTWLRSRNMEQFLVSVPHRSPLEQAFWRGLGAVRWMEVLWIK
jgi:ribosomal protein S18 acetylase RimI-like enzyme